MGRGLKKPRKFYAPDQSPLYKLTTRRALVELLHWKGTPATLIAFVSREDNYRVFENESGRVIQSLKPSLERIHRRLANLLVRIALPDYLHSGRRKRSYVTNGQAHMNGMPALKLDVRKFYPSTKRKHVYRWFLHDMKCAPDVAGLLTSIVCFQQECLPTGSCLSQLLAFHVHKHMFDAIADYAAERGGTFTVYVDDIVISMPHVSWGKVQQVGHFIERQGLAWHKERLYPKGVAKVVTGTVVKANHLEAPNKQHQKLRAALDDCLANSLDGDDRQALIKRVFGCADSIAQVDPRRKALSRFLRGRLMLPAA